MLLLLISAALFTTYEAGVFNGAKSNNKISLKDKNANEISSSLITKNNIDSANADNLKTGLNSQKINQQFSQQSITLNQNSVGNSSLNNKEIIGAKNNLNDAYSMLKTKDDNERLSQNSNDKFSVQQSDNSTVNTSNNKTIEQQSLSNQNATDSVKHEDNVVNNIDSSSNKNIIAQNVIDSTNTSLKTKQKKQINSTRQAFFYAGLNGIADVSFVKNQRTSKIGLGAGFLAGYHFKNGLSIESGISLERKNYYTAGKYFSKDKLNNFLQTSTFEYANGNCDMWELPLNIKYDFRSKKKYNWFVTGGLSSYFMKKEYYNIKFEKDGNSYEKGYDYYNASNNLFSVLNVGAGINMQAAKKYFIQVQPYYKIPLNGVGTGNLSLSSGGLSLSVIRHF